WRAPDESNNRQKIKKIPKMEPAAAILLDVEIVNFLADARAYGIADRPRHLDLGRRLVALPDVLDGKFHGEARDLLGDGLPLRLVTIKDRAQRPAIQRSGNEPGQIGRIGDAGVHSISGVRDPHMRRVAADEGAAVAKAIGDEAPANP